MNRVTVEQIAADLGTTPEKVLRDIRRAVDAGLLRVAADDGEWVELEAAFPEAAS